MYSSLKRAVGAVPPLRAAWIWLRETLLAQRHRRSVFSRHYHDNYWKGAESRSGRGSSLEQTAVIRRLLPPLLAELGVRRMLDIPCGDFHWMSQVPLGIEQYIGADIVPTAVAETSRRFAGPGRTFVTLDAVSDALPPVDLVMCRDLLVHLRLSEAAAAIENFRRSGATWLLTTTFPATTENRDIERGDWRPLNLERAPFNLPPPTRVLLEECTEDEGRYADKSLGLWHLPSLPGAGPKA